MQRLRMTACTSSLDGSIGTVFDESFGNLGTRAVAGAQEQQSRPRAPCLELTWRSGRKCEPGMERSPAFAQEIPAPEKIRSVIDVAAVEGASTSTDDAGPPELGQVVRHHVLRLPDKLHQFAHASIAAAELPDQLPAQRIAEQPEDRWRRGRDHDAHYIRLV